MSQLMRRPLFYAAVFLGGLILLQSYFFPGLDKKFLSKNDISYFVHEDRSPVTLGGTIVSQVEERETFYGSTKASFILKAGRIWETDNKGSMPVSGLVKIYLPNPKSPLDYGDEIVMKGELAFAKGVRNPGGFDTRAYLERQGIRAVFYADKKVEAKVLRHDQGNFIQAGALKVKKALSQSLSETFSPRDASFLKALFLGERSDFEEDFKDLFIKTGTMHILAVSGFNIGFLALSVFFLLKIFPISRDLKYLVTLVAIWSYCLVVGWQAPVVRASVMATVFILGKVLGRKTDILNTLGLAAVIILSVNPGQFFDLGFQLSFLAVFGIAGFLPIFLEKPELLPNEKFTIREKLIRYFKELFWLSFVCQIVTLPITVQNFYIVTPLSLVANLVVVPASFLLFFSGVLFFLTFWWVPKFLAFLPLVMKGLMQLFVGSLFVIENLPGSYVIVGRLEPWLLALLILGVLFLLLDRRIKNSWARTAVLVLFLSNIFLIQDLTRYFHREFRMTALDVGQGDSIYFEFPKGGNLLIDAGRGGDSDKGRWVVAPFLKSKGVRTLDALVISHPQADHIGGMPTVLDEFKIKNVVEAGSRYDTKLFYLVRKKIEKEKAARLLAHLGTKIEGFSDVTILVLNPSGGNAAKNINDDSVVLKVVYKNTSFLLTGDIQEGTIRSLLDQDIASTVLKTPHHGAKLASSGEAFAKAVNPKISVISVGERNPYRHPSPKTIGILNSIPGNRVYRTDESGAVRLVSDGEKVTLVIANRGDEVTL